MAMSIGKQWVAKIALLTLACCLAVGVLGPPHVQAQVTEDELARFGTELAGLVNAHNAQGLVDRFTAASISCPGPDPNATANVCGGLAPGTVVRGYWVGPLYSELGAVDSTGLRAEVNLALDRVPAPVSLATIARQAPFAFLRAQCPDCGAVVLAGAVPPAGGQPVLIFSVRATPEGLRLFSLIRGATLQADERVYIAGGTHRDGTQFIRPGTQPPGPPDTGTGVPTANEDWLAHGGVAFIAAGCGLVAVAVLLAGRRRIGRKVGPFAA